MVGNIATGQLAEAVDCGGGREVSGHRIIGVQGGWFCTDSKRAIVQKAAKTGRYKLSPTRD